MDLQEPDKSCLISSFSGMSCMAALIFSLMVFTVLCHFRLQCRRSSSQSVDKQVNVLRSFDKIRVEVFFYLDRWIEFLNSKSSKFLYMS